MQLEEALELKQTGNENYRQNDYNAAFKSYTLALQYDNDADTNSVQLRFDVLSNLLQTCIKLKKYDGRQHLRMIEFASRYKNNMDIQKMSKALYRCGIFFENDQEWVEASGTYQIVLDYDPNNPEAQAAFARANEALMVQQDVFLQPLADSGYLNKGTAGALLVTTELCVVCQEVLGSEQKCLVLNCSHAFHQMCIITWHSSQKKNTGDISCPVCRAPVMQVV